MMLNPVVENIHCSLLHILLIRHEFLHIGGHLLKEHTHVYLMNLFSHVGHEQWNLRD